ncbi:MAG: hypothetical protein LH606_15650 [Cytophagaceae bacterium]|nr:hypothetical protein [Cytophagaceae bacterium]
METILVEIRNPKAKKLLQDLAELDLIALRPTPQQRWQALSAQLPDVPDEKIPEAEIQAEVQAVRQIRQKQA